MSRIAKIFWIVYLVILFVAPPSFGSFMEPMQGPALVAGPDPISLSDYREMIDYARKRGQKEPVFQGSRYFIRLKGPNYVMPGYNHGFDTVIEFSYVSGPYSGVNLTVTGKRTVQDTKVPTHLYSVVYMDDADEDMQPNSIVQMNIRTEDGMIISQEYKSLSTIFGGWDYFLNFVYKELRAEGM